MSQYLESIKILNGVACNLKYHNYRFLRTQKDLWCGSKYPDIHNYIPAKLPKKGLHKLRVVYDEVDVWTEIQEYFFPMIKALSCVYVKGLDYHLKSTDREIFKYLQQCSDHDGEILIINDGFVTDTSFSNVAFWDGSDWVTPQECLLQGTQRDKLLQSGMLVEMRVPVSKISGFHKIALFNAMIEWDDRIELDIPCIQNQND
jgi:4-amino-4-deoxychorismate lyase